MTTKYWITATGSWELATSWSPAGVPGSADNVVFDTGFTGPGYNNQSSEPTYTVYASTLDADVVNGITVIGDAIRWMGFVATPTLAIENRGYLYVADDALYAGSLTVETGGELAVGGNTQNVNGVYTTEEGLFEDGNGLIIGTGTQQASGVLLSGT